MLARQVEFEADDVHGTRPLLKTDHGSTVLVIDDSRTALMSIKKMLNSYGFRCLIASNAKDGIRIAESVMPDIILMDVEMPELNGFQATRILRDMPKTRGIPVIIISGTYSPATRVWAQKIGANGFLSKPLNGDEFFEMADELICANMAIAN